MQMTHAPEINAEPVPVSGASDMQFGTDFLASAFSADFWYVCHWH